MPPVVLEAKAFATTLVPNRAPSPLALDMIHRALIRAASAVTTAGVPMILDATAPRRAWRDLAQEHCALRRGSAHLP
jgi:predicted kinase